jgi:hypothetical protein
MHAKDGGDDRVDAVDDGEPPDKAEGKRQKSEGSQNLEGGNCSSGSFSLLSFDFLPTSAF